LKLAALACQNGNRGFTEEIDKLLVVTSDLGSFVSPGERNQCWIDGGLFAMSLVYALHSLGLGTCCLNWSVEHEADRKLRQAAGIRESEAVIMMIAVGHLPEVLNVQQSPRKLVDDVLTIR
jgi:nitroreductase